MPEEAVHAFVNWARWGDTRGVISITVHSRGHPGWAAAMEESTALQIGRKIHRMSIWGKSLPFPDGRGLAIKGE